MRDQYSLIHNTRWNILFILDACRPDVFEAVYKDFFTGRYMVVKSRGCPTQYWIANTFPDRYIDIIYLSGNPYITSKKRSLYVTKYWAGQHFYKVDDVWLWGWQGVDGIETVPPWSVIESLKKHLHEIYLHGKRIIAHILQPHSPYIGRTKLDIGNPIGARLQMMGERYISRHPMTDHPKIREAYRDNLILALENIYGFIKRYGHRYRIVITSDHGEYLGENDTYGHTNVNDPFLLGVPWLEVNYVR